MVLNTYCYSQERLSFSLPELLGAATNTTYDICEFEELLKAMQPRLYGFILKRLADQDQARDVLQRTNLVICEKSRGLYAWNKLYRLDLHDCPLSTYGMEKEPIKKSVSFLRQRI